MTSRPRWKTHLAAAELINGHHQSICGQFRQGIVLTHDAAHVTCQHCLHQLTPPLTVPYSGRARWRAMKALAEQYPTEYAQLLERERAAEQATS